MALRVEFCGEWHDLDPTSPFIVGREGDLTIDDNPYLHRRFLEVANRDGLWWLANQGSQLAATVSDRDGRFQAWLAPGAQVPVVFESMAVRFTAGSTAYEVGLHLDAPPFDAVPTDDDQIDGSTTLGRVSLAGEQLVLVVALAEPVLRADGVGRARVPTSAEAAARLGWPLTKFNRKLDNVCQKLKRAGVRGLHGEAGNLASDRRARLVEYALAVRMVTAEDLALLDGRAHEGE
jgi:hypothetical protein